MLQPKTTVFFFSVALIFNPLAAQIGYQINATARSQSMGNTGTGFQDINAIYQNAAGLISVKQASALFATEIRFGLRDLHPLSIAAVFPTQSSVFGFSFQNFSFDTYRENKLTVAYARRLAQKLNIGVDLSYLHLNLNEYGSQGLISLSLGLQATLFKDFIVATYLHNPMPIQLTAFDRTPSVLRLGLAYQLNKTVLICLDAEKDLHLPVAYKWGLEYCMLPILALRCGYTTYPSGFSVGFGYTFQKQFILDLALSQNNALGTTPSLSLRYQWGKEKKELKTKN
jgi:hypothetical protein